MGNKSYKYFFGRGYLLFCYFLLVLSVVVSELKIYCIDSVMSLWGEYLSVLLESVELKFEDTRKRFLVFAFQAFSNEGLGNEL